MAASSMTLDCRRLLFKAQVGSSTRRQLIWPNATNHRVKISARDLSQSIVQACEEYIMSRTN
jgi:hypothetical protein